MTMAAATPPTTAFDDNDGGGAAALDLFAVGRQAAAARDARLGRHGSFVRSRQLCPGGAWRGPRDAAESWADAADLAALGGWPAAAAAGVTLLVGTGDVHRTAQQAGGRSLWRFPYRSGEPAAERRARLEALGALVRGAGGPALPLWGVMPGPDGEPEGLDTLELVAALRLALPEVPHIVLDVAALGPRLAQMALGFGGDELWAPIVSERALRLGGNARNPAMTRKEAAVLIRGAGLSARERLGPDVYGSEEVPA